MINVSNNTLQVLNALVALLIGKHGHQHHDIEPPKKTKKSTRGSVNKGLTEDVNEGPPCCSSDPVKQLDDFQRMASVLEHEIEDAAREAKGDVEINEEQQLDVVVEIEQDEGNKNDKNISDAENSVANTGSATAEVVDNESSENNDEAERLHKMGLNPAIAIALHNFPEGT